MFKVYQVKVPQFWDPKMFTAVYSIMKYQPHLYLRTITNVNILGSKMFTAVYSIIKYQPHLYLRTITIVNILGSHKCALLLDVP